MRDIGYYAGFLSTEDQEEITNGSKEQLVDLLHDVASNLYSFVQAEHGYWIGESLEINQFWCGDHSERDKIALIRGLCDRIELKLMETAQ